MDNKLVVSSSPHLRTPETVDTIMRDVMIALIPPFVVSIWLFGMQSVSVVLIATLAAMITESVIVHRTLKVGFSKLKGDWSAAVTGFILGLSLPPATPWWIVVLGSVAAIGIGKQLFGGLGYNIFNPALVGRAFIVMSWPAQATHWTKPFETVDATSAATPLGEATPTLWELFIGDVAGSLGETSVLAILIGGLFLVYKGHVDFRVPAGYMGAIAILALLAGDGILFHLMSGSALFAAFYMATCMVTSPFTKTGKLIFGIGCGLLTAVFRLYGSAPEGVTYAILLMNALVPFINKYTRPRIYGEVRSS